MPFNNRVSYYPAVGKNVPLRAALEERVKGAASRGGAQGLSVQRFPPEGTVFVITNRYPDLASWEAGVRRNAEGTAAFGEKIASLLRQPNKQELFEQLIPFPPRTGPPGFTARTYNYPALDKAGELRALLEERVKSGPSRGRAMSLFRQLFTPDGPVLVTSTRWPDMATYEATTERTRADTQAFQAKVAALVRQPNKQELFEVLIPLPPAS